MDDGAIVGDAKWIVEEGGREGEGDRGCVRWGGGGYGRSSGGG